MNKLEKNKLIVKKKLSSTNNYVIFTSRFASALTRGKEKNEITPLIQDIYRNRKKIVLSIFILEHLLMEIEISNIYDCNELFKYINSTTLRYRKNQGYKYFEKLYKLNNKKITMLGVECHKNMKNRVINNTSKVSKCIQNRIEKGTEDYSMRNPRQIDYDTVLSRNIHINLNNNSINLYCFDIENNYTVTKAGEYIKDTYDLIEDTLNIESITIFNIYIFTYDNIKKKHLENKIIEIKRKNKYSGYISELDFILEKVKINILDYSIQEKYFNNRNLIALTN